jgi:hypothetical protein
MSNDNEEELPTRRSIQEELRSLGLIGPDEFICIAQDIPPYTPVPVKD